MTCALAPRRRPPRARRQDGPLRRLGHAVAYARRHDRRAPGLPHRRGGVRREPPRHRAGGGARTLDRLQATFTNDLGKIAPGRAQYTHLLDADDASVLDDIIVWWIDDEVFDVMPNASNTERVVAGDRRRATSPHSGDPRRPGPGGTRAAGHDRARGRRRRPVPGRHRGGGAAPSARWPARATRARTASSWPCPAERAALVWEAVLGAGVVPAGLGARDTLRLEAALPLHGHELGPGITPLQAGLGWVVAWDKAAASAVGTRWRPSASGAWPARLRGLAVEGRRPPRAEQAVLDRRRAAGEVTSGNFSPMLGHGIALAFLPPEVGGGRRGGDRRAGRALPATVVPTPFVGGG